MKCIMTIRLRIHTYRTLKYAARAMTLNVLGKMYGLKRVKGESNYRFEKRIMRIAVKRPPITDNTGEARGKS